MCTANIDHREYREAYESLTCVPDRGMCAAFETVYLDEKDSPRYVKQYWAYSWAD